MKENCTASALKGALITGMAGVVIGGLIGGLIPKAALDSSPAP